MSWSTDLKELLDINIEISKPGSYLTLYNVFQPLILDEPPHQISFTNNFTQYIEILFEADVGILTEDKENPSNTKEKEIHELMYLPLLNERQIMKNENTIEQDAYSTNHYSFGDFSDEYNFAVRLFYSKFYKNTTHNQTPSTIMIRDKVTGEAQKKCISIELTSKFQFVLQQTSPLWKNFSITNIKFEYYNILHNSVKENRIYIQSIYETIVEICKKTVLEKNEQSIQQPENKINANNDNNKSQRKGKLPLSMFNAPLDTNIGSTTAKEIKSLCSAITLSRYLFTQTLDIKEDFLSSINKGKKNLYHATTVNMPEPTEQKSDDKTSLNSIQYLLNNDK